MFVIYNKKPFCTVVVTVVLRASVTLKPFLVLPFYRRGN